MDVSVVVGTFGSPDWRDLAYSRAIPSVPEETPVIHRHGQTLAQARNEGLALVQTPYVAFLDADDELSEGYVEAMMRGSAHVRGPVIRFIHGRRVRPWQPRVYGHEHDCEGSCLVDGNWLTAGTVMRTDLVRQVGGWEEWPVFEDWALFARLYRAGATFELIRDAVYVAHVRVDSRNRAPDPDFKHRVHHEIREAVFPELYAEAA